MKAEDSRALDDVLNRYDQKVKERAAAMEKSHSDELRFNADADRAFKDTIRPTMEDVAKRLRERRHECEIKEEEETLTNDLTTRPKRITMTVRAAPPPGPTVVGRVAHGISFSVVRHEKKIAITSARGGSTSTPKNRGSYDVAKLTAGAVTKELTTFLGEVLNK